VEQGGCKGEPDKAACSSVEVKGWRRFLLSFRKNYDSPQRTTQGFPYASPERSGGNTNKVRPKPDATRRRAK